jgi:hypothetical protein
MPDLPSNVPVYTADQPYYYKFDNLPIDSLIQRDNIINAQVDANTAILEEAAGTAGTLPVRLSQCMDPLGNLTALGVNNAEHNIGYHVDGAGPDSVEYVRMTLDERTKLETVAADATSFYIKVTPENTGGSPSNNPVPFEQGFVTFEPSDTVTWSINNGQKITANVVALPDSEVRFSNVVPENAYLTPDYKNYLTGIGAPFLSGSLSVYINGIRIFETKTVYATSMSGVGVVANPNLKWVPRSFVPTINKLGFSLNSGLCSDDVVMIDFAVSTNA